MDGPLRAGWTADEAASFRLFLPQPFAANYAYPLLVFLHDEGRSDADLQDWFPRISGQNFVAAAIQAPFPHPLGLPGKFSWRAERCASAGNGAATAVDCIRRICRIHPDRMYLMGVGAGGQVALPLLLRGGNPFAGGILVDVSTVPATVDLTAPADSVKRFLLVSRGTSNSDCKLGGILQRLRHRVTSFPGPGGHGRSDLYREINRWLMAAIPTTVW